MSYQDPYQQGNQGQNYDPNQQQNQGGQQGYDPNQQGGQQSYDPNQQGGQQQNQGGQFSGAKQQAQQGMDQAIDQFANKIPGGQQYSQQAKDAAGGVLNNLEGEAEKRLGGGLGGLFGGNQGNQDNQGNQGW